MTTAKCHALLLAQDRMDRRGPFISTSRKDSALTSRGPIFRIAEMCFSFVSSFSSSMDMMDMDLLIFRLRGRTKLIS